MTRLLLKNRRPFIVLLHLGLIALSHYAAFWLRFDGHIPAADAETLVRASVVVLLVRGAVFVPFGLYSGLWRYAGIWDLRNIIAGVVTSTILNVVAIRGLLGLTSYPRSVFVIDALLLLCMLGGVRLVRRLWRGPRPQNARTVLILGAGDEGEMIARDMIRDSRYRPIGFIDDNVSSRGQRIHGVPVLGGQADLPAILSAEKPDEVLIALASPAPATIRKLVKTMQPSKIPITIVPPLHDLLAGKVAVNQIRNLSIADLLERAPVGLDGQVVSRLIEGKRVLITGAGGSIGSELSRQVAAHRPARLVLFERYENSLYAIANDLSDRFPLLQMHPVIGDITDVARLEMVFAEEQPQIVFHAAAHKHVPLMEVNCCEAVKNNVLGTRRVAEASVLHNVERFVLISTDKAVNPSSVMGATKRVAELVVRRLAGRSDTRFVTVRFGNVLGSNGSVVPRFLEQINAGGPVTVTHPDMRRFFMLIQEAVELVLHGASVCTGGQLFVLEMGEQVRLLDLARNLIRLSGFVPDEEIPIVFTGLRPGEKLSEELVGAGETIRHSAAAKILEVATGSAFDPIRFGQYLSALEAHALRNDFSQVLRMLSLIVPTYVPSPEVRSTSQLDMGRRLVALPASLVARSGAVAWSGAERRASHGDRRQHQRGGRRVTDQPAGFYRAHAIRGHGTTAEVA